MVTTGFSSAAKAIAVCAFTLIPLGDSRYFSIENVEELEGDHTCVLHCCVL